MMKEKGVADKWALNSLKKLVAKGSEVSRKRASRARKERLRRQKTAAPKRASVADEELEPRVSNTAIVDVREGGVDGFALGRELLFGRSFCHFAGGG
jgi:hypothetical protein